MFQSIPGDSHPAPPRKKQRPSLEPLEPRRLLSVTPVAFGAQMNISDNGIPESIAVADMNGDGKLDLVTQDYAGTVSVLLGNGDGAFAIKQTISDGFANGSGVICVGNFVAGGPPDVAATYGNGLISILLGDANHDGGLQPPHTIATTGQIQSLLAVDVNGDGKTDLVAADGNGEISVFLGNGDGTFKAPINTAVSASGANHVIAAHFVNGANATLDLAVSNYTTGSVTVLIGNGDGHFRAAGTYYGFGHPTDLAAADFDSNQNQNTDLVVSSYTGMFELLGNGNGTFQSASNLPLPANVAFVSAGDLNGDGKPDLVMTAHYYGVGGSIAVSLGNGDGTFLPAQIAALGNYPQSPVIADIDGDGRPDIAVAVTDQSAVAEFLNESYNLPSITITPAGVVTANGTPGNDTISLTQTGNQLTVTVDSDTRTFGAAGVSQINVKGGAGNDSITIGAGVAAVYAMGGGANDTIIASNHANDSLDGGAGRDFIQGGRGYQLLDGGNGADTLVAGAGPETLTGDGGFDSLVGGPGADSLDGANGNNTLRAGTGPTTLLGGTGNDRLIGGPGADSMDGAAGNDTIIAGTGNNTLRGNDGNDSLNGSAGGNDYLSGGPGNDTLIGDTSGGNGIDTLVAGTGSDSIRPGPHDH
jgi:Ca2+-binding RTX toxin-like protein